MLVCGISQQRALACSVQLGGATAFWCCPHCHLLPLRCGSCCHCWLHAQHVAFIAPCHSPEDEALAALRIISAALGKARLRHLNLSDNALGEKGIRACAAAFSDQVGAAREWVGGWVLLESALAGGCCWISDQVGAAGEWVGRWCQGWVSFPELHTLMPC